MGNVTFTIALLPGYPEAELLGEVFSILFRDWSCATRSDSQSQRTD